MSAPDKAAPDNAAPDNAAPDNAALDIAEVVRRSGIPASTLRYYEDKGLIAPVGRHGLRRQYDPAVLDRLALIALTRSAGFSLDEISGMFAADGRPHIDRHLFSAKADELDATLRRLTALRDSLRHVAACPAPTHTACPTFRALLASALPPPTGPRRPSGGVRPRHRGPSPWSVTPDSPPRPR
ncbi:Redox-sensitive transcriptional activator SoxR [Streptomyces sp. YIM 130001]|uniref:helix-turn-helix domain-containing protein n=1 Tax=Streptomyces sp. YIM 130001 TaxID=2259644 RepID=UPI000E659143|nr:helix-turn-helix domain-containing protein [Streptomyces sp. YIM 130001]RII15108.1 Redox-sensitive transcriptional activator SoxR [Streptomyces sp. YIM 130001]